MMDKKNEIGGCRCGAANKDSNEKLVSYQHPDYDTDNWLPSHQKENR